MWEEGTKTLGNIGRAWTILASVERKKMYSVSQRVGIWDWTELDDCFLIFGT